MNLRQLFSIRKTKTPSTLPLILFNTLSKKKEVFEPREKRVVKIYSCGPTVYDYQHIGNLRGAVLSDTLRRVLTFNNFTVRQVINITDVGHLTSDADAGEDKMSKGLKEAGKDLTLKNMLSLGKKYGKAFFDDLANLNIKTDAIIFPYASDYINEQIALIKTLEEKGYTYQISDGIYFETSNFPSYGKLGSIDLKHQKSKARVKENKEKHQPSDFALWKLNKKIGWDSPWGKGFPGWHAECTAMIFAELGKQIDIHTGGIDLIPIHHNNEIAQAESVTGKQYVKYWLHNAFITIEGQKISKSIGNTIYLRHIIDREFSPIAYRYWLLTAHYRTPVNFTWDALSGAQTALTRLHRFFIEELGEINGVVNASYEKRFHKAVNNDLDTPKAIAILWELVHDNTLSKREKRATLLSYDKVLGLGLHEGSKRLKEMLRDEKKRLSVTEAPKTVQKLVREREDARGKHKWEQADELRKTIEAQGYLVEDTKEGPEIKEV